MAAPASPKASAEPPERPAASADRCSVVLYGDSILHGGYGGNQRLAEPPARTLQRLRPRYRVEDRSANGETATARAGRFASEPRTAHFVVIAHGINDVAQGLPVQPPLRQMVRQAQQEGRQVVLTGLSRPALAMPGRSAADAAIRQVAAETGAAFAGWGDVTRGPDEMADPLHPAKPYSDRLVARIALTLDAMAPECR